ncbi:hypothetical protein [Rhizobium leguminosarum]|uniref:hypothetical protein n=1 Tax=Rhizobium leguminosarum TaxID=384 RepID=UPI001C904130|nr:hypothetical protein [Rhizobium leguminosarum]MBY2911340.1 hypothetical protein [Rhizobium leguminosarum]
MADTIDVKDANGDVLLVATNDAIVASVDAVKASVDTLDGSVDAVKTSVDAVKTSVDTLDGSVDAVKASVDAGNVLLTAQAGMIDGLEALLTAVGASLTTANGRAVAQLGARTVVQSPAVNIATDQSPIPVDQKSTAHDITVTLTRPANVTPYTAGDVVGQTGGGVLTFAGIGKVGGGAILITRAELELDIAALPSGMGSFRLYLYSAAPASALADNAPFTFLLGDRPGFLGFIDLGTPVLIGGGTLYCKVSGINEQFKLTTADISAYLVTAGGYTSAANSEVYKITLHSVDV